MMYKTVFEFVHFLTIPHVVKILAKKITFLDLMASLVSILSGKNGPSLILYSQFEGVTQISGLR